MCLGTSLIPTQSCGPPPLNPFTRLFKSQYKAHGSIQYYYDVHKGSEHIMAVVRATETDIKLLARLMRAEAEGEGNLGMLLAGNVMVNRAKAACLDFKDIKGIRDMVYQQPGGFEAIQKGYFYQAARESEISLARKLIQGQRFHPATNSLWFFRPGGNCPPQWFNQWNTGRYKAHCFYQPTEADCPGAYRAL